MSKSNYEHLLESVSDPIKVESVGPHRWAWIGNDPVSPTIVTAWIEAGLIVQRGSGWVKAREVQKCKTCGQEVTDEIVQARKTT